ncbi:MAG: phospholipase D family protein, partial [Dehalococcoidales bacterium]|nr:phospholipase D family protein [Dehalococcoidales bacterium]
MRGQGKNNTKDSSVLFISPAALKTVVISRLGDMDSLFSGFSRMRAISYVASPDLLLDLFDSRGYTDVEIIVGENLSASYKSILEQKNIEITERLADLVEKGKLRVYIPSRTIHTKLYFLECLDFVRVIQTSANLTDTAQNAKKQVNYAWYLDLPHSDVTLNQLIHDYESHLEGCTLFMDDLRELMGLNQDIEKKQLIEAWLKGRIQDEQEVEIKRVFRELSASLIETDSSGDQTVAVLKLPDSLETKKKFERILAPLKPVVSTDNQIQISNSAYIRYVFETRRVPLLLLDNRRNELLLGFEFPMSKLTLPLPDPLQVNDALGLLESYFQTVDLGQSVDHLAVKTNMYEAILYTFFAPFAHEYMKLKRLHFGQFDTRGPRFLYIYGPSQNGKSTFLRFALKLLTGRAIEPLSREDFTRTRIINASMTGTLFPLAFDDVDPAYSGLGDIF